MELELFGKTIPEIIAEIQLLLLSFFIFILFYFLLKLFSKKGFNRLILGDVKQGSFFLSLIVITTMIFLFLHLWLL